MRPRSVAIALWLLASGCAGGEPVRPDLFVVLLDTVRADRLSAYGYERPTSPNLEAWAQRGVRFENASSTSSWTIPAHASLFTGLLPTFERVGFREVARRSDKRPIVRKKLR